MQKKSLTILFVVCHPDDEVVWAGGLLCELARLPFVRSYVVCLSGYDTTSPRMAEFEAARWVAGYTAGVICGGPLRGAIDPLPPCAETLSHGMAQLGLTPDAINLLVTHAPFGDEHRNPHHIQAHRELKAWCAGRRIGFAHFACITLPGVTHRSMLADLRRHGTLRLLQLARCRGPRGTPAYYAQFVSDPAAKLKLVRCYPSIGLAEHEEGYTMFSNPCEALYLQDERALAPIMRLAEVMTAPGPSPLVERRPLVARIASRLRRLGRAR
ncbi:MAG TPA: hypothetical protein VGH23_13955 [Rhizomicrobium sp.]|jgi:LmbE family N-acetylglucosaminyl deacetylase